MALGTSKRKKRENSPSGWRRRIEMCYTYIQSLMDLRSGRFGFVLTSQWTTRAPLDWSRRQRRQGSRFGFVFAATRVATPMLLPLGSLVDRRRSTRGSLGITIVSAMGIFGGSPEKHTENLKHSREEDNAATNISNGELGFL
jgi:hypothetical protein